MPDTPAPPLTVTSDPAPDEYKAMIDLLHHRMTLIEQKVPACQANNSDIDIATGKPSHNSGGIAWRSYASDKLIANAEAIERVEASTAGIVDMMQTWTGAMRTIDAVGKVLRPITYIIGFITALVALWAALRHTNWTD